MNNTRVGVATLLRNDNKILLGKRKAELGKGSWGLPGGKLEFGENPKDCAIRELYEETNLISSIDDLHFIGFSNTVFDENTHYITLIYSVNVYSGELKIMEEDKCEKWEWFDVNDLPKNLFKPFENYLIDNNL